MDRSGEKEAAKAKLALIDQTLDREGLALGFSDELEEQFEKETGPARSRMYVRLGTLFLAMYASLIAVDYVCLTDVFGLAIVLRLGLATFITALGLWIISHNPPVIIREWVSVGIYLTQAIVVYVLVVASDNPLRENYHVGILLILMFCVIVLRLRFRYCVAAAVTILATEWLTILSLDFAAPESQGASMFLSLTFAIFALTAVYSLEKLERQSWLHSVRDRLRAKVFEELSFIDPLTGLGNRRALQQWVGEQRLRAEGQAVSLVIADIDYFKVYNDTFGHLAGDDCIRRIAGVLVSEARKTGDRVFRFGGEEFIVFLAGLDLPAASVVAERLRLAVAAKRIPHHTPTELNIVTASFGVASAALDRDFELDALIDEADRALYDAKNSGRNRVSPTIVVVAEEMRAVG